MEDDAAIRVALVRKPRGESVPSPFWPKVWAHLRERLTGIVVYGIVGLSILVMIVGWRVFFSKSVLVISPFSVPVNGDAPIGLSGKSAANLLLDKVEELSNEANEYGQRATAPFLNTERHEEAPDVKVEVAGLSVEGVLAALSRVLEKQQIVTGELYWVKEGVIIRARLENDVWTVGPFPATAVELDKQYRMLARNLLSVTNPNIAGLIFQKDGEVNLAQKSFTNWLSLKGLDADSRAQANFHLGVVLDLSGSRPSAEQSYQNALSIQPAFFEALVNLGLDLYTDGRTNDAILRLRQASDLKPHSLAPLMILGLAQVDPADKEMTYRKALALYPEMPAIHYQLALALQQLNRQADAKAEMELYSKLSKPSAPAVPKRPAN